MLHCPEATPPSFFFSPVIYQSEEGSFASGMRKVHQPQRHPPFSLQTLF